MGGVSLSSGSFVLIFAIFLSLSFPVATKQLLVGKASCTNQN